jgi:hypothetical protein
VLRSFDEMDIPGVGRLQKEASQQLERFYNDLDVGFSPHERAGFEPVLRMCHARLTPDAVYEPDTRVGSDRSLPAVDGKFRITAGSSTCASGRPTSGATTSGGFPVAIEAAEDAKLPAPALQMTTRPTDAAVDGDAVDLGDTVIRFPDASDAGTSPLIGGGSGGGHCPAEERTYFFPLPYNADQIEIVRRLERKDVRG